MGIVSCLGNTLDAVAAALREGRSGLSAVSAWHALGLASQVAGVACVADEAPFPRKFERFMGDTARLACHAARKAVEDAALDPALLQSPRVGAVVGSGSGALSAYDAALAISRSRGVDRVPPYVVPQAMSSTVSANLAQVFGIGGISYSPSSACTTSALAIGQAAHWIRSGQQDIVLAGGAEELHDNYALLFDAMGALSRASADTPHLASRPYDTARDGFVLASGAGVLVLESLTHARARGARIYAEVIGFGQSTDSSSMVSPQAASIARAIRDTLRHTEAPPDYINTHGPSTPSGDLEEAPRAQGCIRPEHTGVLLYQGTDRASTRCGGCPRSHLHAADDARRVHCRLPEYRDARIGGHGHALVRRSRPADLRTTMSISFGFGGSCAGLMFGADPGDFYS